MGAVPCSGRLDSASAVQANPDQLKLVWTNLLSNAIKCTEPGGIVAAALKQTPEHLISTVRDTGIGIPPEDEQRMLEEFYRAEGAGLPGTPMPAPYSRSVRP